jgi:hypothetical protein
MQINLGKGRAEDTAFFADMQILGHFFRFSYIYVAKRAR